jgi:hypothetical protein
MLMLILTIIFITGAGTWLSYKLLPESRKEWCLLPMLFMGALLYVGITGWISFYAWVMVSALSGSGLWPGIIIGGLWLIVTIAVVRSWLN